MAKQSIFNAVTATELKTYAKRLSHGILLHGSAGVGLDTAAEWLANQAEASVLRILPEHNDKVDLENGSITINVIRRLYDLTRTKAKKRQLVIITAADTITNEAQHAFLKLLEEPNDNITFVLLCHQPWLLLPTVTSRLQAVQVRKIDKHQSEALLTSLDVKDVTVRAQILFIAEGLPGLLTQLAQSEALLEAEAAQVKKARSMIQGSTYQRLVAVQTLKDDRAAALKLVLYMIRLLRREVSKKQSADTETLKLLSQLEKAQVRLEANGNIRLSLAAAML